MAREDLDFGAVRCLNDGHNNIIMGEPIMTKLSVLGIIGGAALLAATPYSLQWPQQNAGSTAPTSLLTLSQAEAQTSGMQRRDERREGRQDRRTQRRTGQ